MKVVVPELKIIFALPDTSRDELDLKAKQILEAIEQATTLILGTPCPSTGHKHTPWFDRKCKDVLSRLREAEHGEQQNACKRELRYVFRHAK
jgi:hypothetical protein